MKFEISVPEVVSIFKEIQNQSERPFEMIQVDIRENIGEYLSKLMDMELTHFLANKELIDAVESWRSRDLSRESIKYLLKDGITLEVKAYRKSA